MKHVHIYTSMVGSYFKTSRLLQSYYQYRFSKKKDFIKNFMSWWNVDIFIFTKNKNKFKIRIFTNDTERHDRSRRLAFITWICSINDIFPTEQSIVYSCVSRYLEKLIKNKIILSAPVCTIVACIFVSDLCRIYL